MINRFHVKDHRHHRCRGSVSMKKSIQKHKNCHHIRASSCQNE